MLGPLKILCDIVCLSEISNQVDPKLNKEKNGYRNQRSGIYEILHVIVCLSETSNQLALKFSGEKGSRNKNHGHI